MINKKFNLLFAGLFLIVVLTGIINAATLSEWRLNSTGSSHNVHSNINAGNFVAGTGLSSLNFSSEGASAEAWTSGDSLDSNDYFQFSLASTSDYELKLEKIEFSDKRDADGPVNYEIRWSRQSDFSTSSLISSGDITESESSKSFTTNIIASDGQSLYIRIYAYNSNSSNGTYTLLANSLILTGSVTKLTTEPETCEYSNLGNNLEIRIRDVTVDTGFGDRDRYWYPLDEITMEIELRNRGNDYINEITLDWGLWDPQDQNWVVDGRERYFDIDSGDRETIELSFKLDNIRDFQSTKRYVFYVWATGEDDEFDGQDTCHLTSFNVDVINDDTFILLDNIIILPSEAACRSSVELTADAWNIGKSRQRDISVRIYSPGLGLDQRITIDEITSFNREKLVYSFEVLRDVAERSHTIELWVYDRNNKIYETSKDKNKAVFYTTLDVKGNCETTTPIEDDFSKNMVVSAVLESGGKAGEDLVVKATITNIGDKRYLFITDATDYSNWATFKGITPSIVSNLGQGESATVYMNFNVKEDASGEKNFNIVLTSVETGKVFSQPVQLNIEEKKDFFSAFFKENILVISLSVLIAILIIIIIIVLIVRVASR